VLNIPDAQPVLLNVLRKRLTPIRRRGVDAAIGAIGAALKNQVDGVAQAIARGQQVDAAFRELIAVTAQYLKIVAVALNDNRVGSDAMPAVGEFLVVAQEVFTAASQHFAEGAVNGKPFTIDQVENHAIRLLNVYEWTGTEDGTKGLLSTTPIGVTYDQIKLPPLPKEEPKVAPVPTPPPTEGPTAPPEPEEPEAPESAATTPAP